MLEIIDLVKQYPNGLRALHGVSLTISEPQVVAVIGSSGAGKSTLIRCINRLVEPTSGSVKLDDEELTTLGGAKLRRARRHIGMIFQEYNLVERLTVMENVLSGRLGYVSFWQAYRRNYPPEDVRSAFELLDRVGLEGRHDTRADNLSGGQRQRVGIARALMQNPNLLLVDEPTASLDPKTSRQIMRLICELAHERGTPALVNIHDVGLAQNFSDRVIGLSEGRLIFDGPTAGLTAEVLTQIYGEEDWSQTIRRDDDDSEGDGDIPPTSDSQDERVRGEAAAG
ncbi:MAG: phosphonate ABC transporter ATP-binding protein [Alphaproteobacteria bacterium]|nr:phosphonate ABC transporter ATP-binding protein [Rhodospirillaceae bacterium]MDP6407101.1 phosphonate ABC transporter ATP-binding protein [Alphaproteobacteria bacterium]